MNKTNLKKQYSDKERNAAALEAFFNIADCWGLTNDENKVLLGLSQDSSSYYNWKRSKKGILQPDQLYRISYILGIYKSLRILFTDKQQGYEWIKKYNKDLRKSALEVMLQGQIADLMRVRDYLDAQRGCC